MKYLVREVDAAYPFQVVKDLGEDCQVIGKMYKVVAELTHKPSADIVADQLNKYGILYLPGKIFE